MYRDRTHAPPARVLSTLPRFSRASVWTRRCGGKGEVRSRDHSVLSTFNPTPRDDSALDSPLPPLRSCERRRERKGGGRGGEGATPDEWAAASWHTAAEGEGDSSDESGHHVNTTGACRPGRPPSFPATAAAAAAPSPLPLFHSKRLPHTRRERSGGGTRHRHDPAAHPRVRLHRRRPHTRTLSHGTPATRPALYSVRRSQISLLFSLGGERERSRR